MGIKKMKIPIEGEVDISVWAKFGPATVMHASPAPVKMTTAPVSVHVVKLMLI